MQQTLLGTDSAGGSEGDSGTDSAEVEGVRRVTAGEMQQAAEVLEELNVEFE